jgi:hypothetical protein
LKVLTILDLFYLSQFYFTIRNPGPEGQKKKKKNFL